MENLHTEEISFLAKLINVDRYKNMSRQHLESLRTILYAFAYNRKPNKKFTSKSKMKSTPNPKVKGNLSLNLLCLNPFQLT